MQHQPTPQDYKEAILCLRKAGKLLDAAETETSNQGFIDKIDQAGDCISLARVSVTGMRGCED